MPNFRSSLIVVLALLAAALPAMSARAQATPPQDAAAAIELLENRIAEIESAELAEATRSSIVERYRQAIGLVEQHREFEARTAEFTRAREAAPQQADTLRRELRQLESTPPPRLGDGLAAERLPQLEQRLLTEKADLTALRGRVDELTQRLDAQTQRPEQARARLTAARGRQPEVAEALAAPTPESESPRLTEARRWALEIEARALAAEIEMLNQELLSHPMRVELLGVQRDLAALRVTRATQFVERLEALVVARRQADAESARVEAEETERRAEGKHPILQALAQRNTQLVEELGAQTDSLERVTRDENRAAERAQRIAENFRLARQKLEIAGLSEALGQVLLEQRRGLPDAADFRAARERREQLVVDSSLRQIRHQQEREQMRDLGAYVDELIGHLDVVDQARLRDEVTRLAEARRELLDKAIAADDTFLQALGELDFAQRQLAETVADYDAFLDERLLWVRSGEPPSWQTLESIGATLAIFASPAHWRELARALFLPGFVPWWLLAGVVLFALLRGATSALRESLQRSGRHVGELHQDRYVATLRALLHTLIIALPWPILFAAIGLHLQQATGANALDFDAGLYANLPDSGQFVAAVGAAFGGIALYAYYFIAFRIYCEPGGLAIVHFDWNPRDCARVRAETLRLMGIFLPIGFLLIAATTYDPAALAGGLSRLCFFIVMAALAWFCVRIFAPARGAMARFYLAFPHSAVTWFRHLWLGLGLSLPLALAVLAVTGYVYTAAQFGARLIDTAWLIVAIVLLHQLVVRWLILTERRLVYEDTLERHRAQQARDGQPDDTAAAGTHASDAEEPEVDYSSLGEDTKKLISTVLTLLALFGLWIIWSDVLPAFGILDGVTLWRYTSTTDGVDTLVPVTLGDALLALLVVGIAFIAALRLPALIEILLLARLRITAGSRYAISTLTQYAIVGAGIVLVFNLLGGSWSEIQWLVAALGVGIGFGLQEIVANFISGLILLFERPIRIGDIVTVGDTTGTVTRIRIRSTTIRNWDQQELVVPNKEFITGRLLNWTLTDPIARIVIPVGVAYGSDVAEAIRLIREAASEHEQVLADPEPMVTFENFGDSALVIVLRCYIGSMEHRLQTQSELNFAISRKLEDAGIVIAFPQRDVHLDTSQPLDVRVHRVAEES